MNSLILAGGMGTRLRPLTTTIPKPIVPLMNRPFAHYQIRSLVKAGISDIVLSLSHLPERIESVLGDGSNLGAKLKYAIEPSPLGTAGAYKFASANLSGPVMVLNGDVFTDLDLSELVRFHIEKESKATLALFPVADPSAYGVVVTDDSGKVKRFLEKPSKGDIAALGSTNINAGIYILEPEILDLIAPGEITSFEYDIFPKILKLGLPFYGFEMSGNYWRDIGSPQSYLAAHMDCLAGVVALHEKIARDGTGEKACGIISEDCHIGRDTQIRNSVIGPGVRVESEARIENSVIWSNSKISSKVRINSSVVGHGCHVGKDIYLANVVLGEATFLADYSRLVSGHS